MGGIGKTELALQYAHKYKTEYPGGVWWIGQADRVLQVLNYGKRMGLQNPPDSIQTDGERVQWLYERWLSEIREGLRLVILDDVLKYEEVRRDFLPLMDSFRLLLTTRERFSKQSVKRLDLGVLRRASAFRLLCRLLDDDNRIKAEVSAAKALCDWVGCLPLGIELIGRYLASREDLQLVILLKRLEEQRLEARAFKNIPPEMPYQETENLEAAFDLSWQLLTPDAQRLGCLLSDFALAPIRREWVAVCFSDWSEERLEEAEIELVKKSLLSLKEKRYLLHPLIREFLRAKLEETGQEEHLKKSLASTLVEIAKKVPTTFRDFTSAMVLDTKYRMFTPEILESSQDAIAHLEELAQNMTDSISDGDLIEPFLGLGRFYNMRGLYNLSKSWYEKGLSVINHRLGKENCSFATILGSLGAFHILQGKYVKAELILKRVLKLQRTHLEAEDPHLAVGLDHLGEVLRLQGKKAGNLEEAEELLIEGKELRISVLGENSFEIAHSFINLAILYRVQGQFAQKIKRFDEAKKKFDEAADLLQKALQIQKRFLTREHPDIARSMDKLGIVYRLQGKLNQAEQQHLKALKLQRIFFREEDPSVFDIKRNLADVYFAQGRLDDAEAVHNEVLKVQKSVWPEGNRHVTKTIHKIVAIYRRRGKELEEKGNPEGAESFYKKAIDLQKKELPEKERNLVPARLDIVRLYKNRRNGDKKVFKKLQPLLLKILKEQRSGSAKPQNIAMTLKKIGDLYRSNSRKNQAKSFYKEAKQIYLEILGDNDPNTFQYRGYLDHCRRVLQTYSDND